MVSERAVNALKTDGGGGGGLTQVTIAANIIPSRKLPPTLSAAHSTPVPTCLTPAPTRSQPDAPSTGGATAAGSRSGLSGGGGGSSPYCLADRRALRGGDGVCACVVSASGVL